VPDVRNGGTWVVATMTAVSARETHVTIEHLVWKQGLQWDPAYGHFVAGWGGLMDRLKRRFTSGPIDWANEPMMYQKVKT
jgi:hypothetical protein